MRGYVEAQHPRLHGKWVKKGHGGAGITAPKAPSAPKAPAGNGKTKKGLTAEAAKKFVGDHYGSWRDKLTPAQEKGLRFYQSPGFALMNGQLRGVDLPALKAREHASDSDLARAKIASKGLTAAIKTAPPLTEPLTVYRGFSASRYPHEVGATVTDPGFTSTSLTPDVATVGKATAQATAEITLPAGTRAAAGSSRELVLPPNSKFRVTKVTTRGGVPHVTMEYVLPPEKMPVAASIGEALTAANWVEKAGGLPPYIKRIAKHLQERGMGQSLAIATAVNAAKRMCSSGDLNWPGLQHVNPGSKAEACAAVADWEAKKSKSHAS